MQEVSVVGTIQNVFSRREMKYLIDDAQYSSLNKFLKGYMKEDVYGRYTVGNTYFDTNEYDIIRRSLEKPVYKEKLRTRCYTVPEKDTEIFIELKKKYKGIVFKRRAVMTMDEARTYLQNGQKPASNDQILSEIDWFLNMYHPKPSMYIAYDRVALTGIEDPSLRVTFDSNIRWRICDTDLSYGTWGRKLLEDGQYVMEVKADKAIPFWLADKFSELNIFKTSFSKYGRCFLQQNAENSGKKTMNDTENIIDFPGVHLNNACTDNDKKIWRNTDYVRQYIAVDG